MPRGRQQVSDILYGETAPRGDAQATEANVELAKRQNVHYLSEQLLKQPIHQSLPTFRRAGSMRGFSGGLHWGARIKELPNEWFSRRAVDHYPSTEEKVILDDDLDLIYERLDQGLAAEELVVKQSDEATITFNKLQQESRYEDIVTAPIDEIAAVEYLNDNSGKWALCTPEDGHIALLCYLDDNEHIIGYHSDFDLEHHFTSD